MARSIGTAVENNFTGGLVTEATALNFPENAVTSTENCIFNKTGSVSRRTGIGVEAGAQFNTNPLDNVSTTFLWKTVAGQGTQQIEVVQSGNWLYFYNMTNGALSANKYSYALDLRFASLQTGLNPGAFESQFAMGNGFLFVTNPLCQPFYIKFDAPTNTFTPKVIFPMVRDFQGLVDDSIGLTTRPTTLSVAQRYNLMNQGWIPRTIDEFFNQIRAYPANSDVWWLLKDAAGNFKPGPIETVIPFKDRTITNYGDLKADSVFRGNTPAGRGHYVLNAFTLDRAAYTGVGDNSQSAGNARPSSVSFFAGRVFYSGTVAPGFTDKIYFSQIIEREAQFGLCYQENDPTSEGSFNLLPSDGGTISIPDAGIIYKMFPIAGTLVVFASNGIWAITGSTGIGFSATDYTVQRLSSITCNSASSFVDIEGYPAFWNDDGIYSVIPNQAGALQVQSMTEQKIKTFYGTIPLSSKKLCRGYYNPTDKTVQWLYNSAETNGSYTFDSVLLFNTQIQSFYTWKFSSKDNYRIAGLFVSFGTQKQDTDVAVTATGGNVTTTTNALVTTRQSVSIPISFKYKYLLYTPSGLTFGELSDDVYKDWGDTLYSSNFVTGYKLRGDGTRESQVNYLIVYFQKLYGASFIVQAQWDFSNNRNSGRWSVPQVVSSGRGNYDYDNRKLKIRGHGKSVQYRFTSTDEDPFTITGWVSTDSVNSTI